MVRESEATYTVEALAKRWNIGRVSAYEAVKRGEIPHFKVGKRILISKAAIERMENGKK